MAKVIASETRIHPRRLGRFSHSSLFFDFVIALVPISAFGCFMFGFRALILLSISILSSVIFELLGGLIFHLPMRLSDGSAIISGWILALTLPAAVPYWVPVIGSAFAMLVIKAPFGGNGHNFMNPAIGARVFLGICFPFWMEAYVLPGTPLPLTEISIQELPDIVLTTPQLLALEEIPTDSVYDLFLGNSAGDIGTISVFFTLIGFVYLLIRKVITWEIPVACLGFLGLLSVASPYAEVEESFALYVLFGGSAFFVSVFAAADPVTTPMSRSGRLLFGLFMGVVCYILQRFTSLGDAAYATLLLANILSYPFDLVATKKPQEGKGGVK